MKKAGSCGFIKSVAVQQVERTMFYIGGGVNSTEIASTTGIAFRRLGMASGRPSVAFWGGLALAILFSCIPVLLRGYTYPPGDDPVMLAGRMGWGLHRYYGQWGANLLGMTLYYYLTPMFAYLGCWALLWRYGSITPVLAWASLWLICRTLLLDLHAGTFVGIINFYWIGFILLRTIAEQRWAWAMGLAALVVPFHTATGLMLTLGMGCYAVLFRRWQVGLIAGALVLAAGLSWWLLSSSVSLIIYAGRVPNAYDMSLARLVVEYIGFGLIVYWYLSMTAVIYAWQAGWRPKLDPALVMLAIMAALLGLMNLPGLSVNTDRTTKLLVGILTVLATAGIVQGLKYLHRPALNWTSTGVIGGALAMAAPQNLAYWLLSGSYR